MFIFRTSDYRSFTGGKLREPVSVPRLQVVQEETLENEVVTNNTTWYLTFTIQEKRIFGAYDDSQAMLVKDYFAGHSQMANFKLARIRTLMKKVPGNEENAQPILSFLRQVKIYKESFVDRNGPYDNIKEHFQRCLSQNNRNSSNGTSLSHRFERRRLLDQCHRIATKI